MQIYCWIFLLSILRQFPLNFGQQSNVSSVAVVPCQSNGIWGDWSNWTACPTSPFLFALSSLNVQQRIRPCLPQPAGCQIPPSSSIAPFNCTGSYSDVRACPSPNANPISAIPQFGSLPQQQITISGIGGAGFGSAWTATMLQSMQIGGNNLGNLNAGMAQTMQINGTGGK